jgi:hypothetical protein
MYSAIIFVFRKSLNSSGESRTLLPPNHAAKNGTARGLDRYYPSTLHVELTPITTYSRKTVLAHPSELSIDDLLVFFLGVEWTRL